MKSFEWSQPRSLADALVQLGKDRVPKAGGVDLLDLMKEGLVAPRRLVDVKQLPELAEIRGTGGGLSIGAAVTLAQLAADVRIRSRAPALADAVEHAATPQLRNLATLGGNLMQRPRCGYFRSADFRCRKQGGRVCYAQEGHNEGHAVFDNQICAFVHPSSPATALWALGAEVDLVGPKGSRRVAISRFFVTPDQDVSRETVVQDGELITRIQLPAPMPGQRSAYFKQQHKASFDWPLVDVAVSLTMDGDVVRSASVVLGAVAGRPWPAEAAERELVGKRLTSGRIEAASRAATRGATPLAMNGYKLPLIETLVRRLITQCGGMS